DPEPEPEAARAARPPQRPSAETARFGKRTLSSSPKSIPPLDGTRTRVEFDSACGYAHAVAWFADRGAYADFRVAKLTRLLAAGWLESDMEYSRGRVPFRDRLALRRIKALTQAFQPLWFMGGQFCSLCPAGGPYGYANIFLPDAKQAGTMWVAPEL